MNQKQRIVAIAGAILLIIMFLYPPFHFVTETATLNGGYSFIFNPPRDGMATVNIVQLTLQMSVAGVVGGIAWYLFKDKS